MLRRAARLVAEIRRPLHPADPERRSGRRCWSVDFRSPDRLRAYARFDADACQRRPMDAGRAARPRPSCFHRRSGRDMQRYQGLVALDGDGSKRPRMNISCARSRSRPASASRSARNSSRGEGRAHRWRAGGMLLQFLPKARGARAPGRSRSGRCAPEGAARACTSRKMMPGVEGQSLIGTVEDVELIDPGAVRASGCSTGCSTSAACACLRRSQSRRSAPARVMRCRRCWRASPRKTASIWSRTARSSSPASSAPRSTSSTRRTSTPSRLRRHCRGVAMARVRQLARRRQILELEL